MVGLGPQPGGGGCLLIDAGGTNDLAGEAAQAHAGGKGAGGRCGGGDAIAEGEGPQPTPLGIHVRCGPGERGEKGGANTG